MFNAVNSPDEEKQNNEKEGKTKFAHSNGYQQLLTDENDRFNEQRVVSIGADGDARVWFVNSLDLDEDEPEDLRLGDEVTAGAWRSSRLCVGIVTRDKRSVLELFDWPECTSHRTLLRFTLPITAVCIANDVEHVAAGGADCDVKYVNIHQLTEYKRFQGHTAPILSIAIDNDRQFLASSSADGDVRIWSLIGDNKNAVKTISNVQKKCNDRNVNNPLTQLNFHPGTPQELVVPHSDSIRVYSYGEWRELRRISHPSLNGEVFSLCCLSTFGQQVAASTMTGFICIFDYTSSELLCKVRAPNKSPLASIVFQPGIQTADEASVAFVDWNGDMGTLSDVLKAQGSTRAPQMTSSLVKSDDEASRDPVEQSKRVPPHRPTILDDDDEIEDDLNDLDGRSSRNSIDLLALKQAYGFNNDGEQVPVPRAQPQAVAPAASVPATLPKNDDTAPLPHTTLSAPKIKPPQRSFNPASTPSHLSLRFLKWNYWGIIRSYETENECSLEVEYHNTSIYAPQVLSNAADSFSLGDMNEHAYVLANRADREGASDNVSVVRVYRIGGEASSREWTSQMPTGENIECVVIGGSDFVAVATDRQLVRVYTLSGVQIQLIAVPGAFVSMCAYGQQLCVVYATGVMIDEEQRSIQATKALIVHIEKRGHKTQRASKTLDVPLSINTHLAWIGYSRSGNLCAYDTGGLLYRYNSRHWTPIFDARVECSNSSDSLWVFDVNEDPCVVRCFRCKGVRYPSVLPAPVPLNVPWTIPIADANTERGKLEQLLVTAAERLLTNGESEGLTQTARTEQLTALLKLFSVAIKGEREARCIDIAHMMPSTEAVQQLIKFAAQMKRLGLAERLGVLAREKKEDEEMEEEKQEEDEEAIVEHSISNETAGSAPKSAQIVRPAVTLQRRGARAPTSTTWIKQDTASHSQRTQSPTSLNETTTSTTSTRSTFNPFTRRVKAEATASTSSIFESYNDSTQQRKRHPSDEQQAEPKRTKQQKSIMASFVKRGKENIAPEEASTRDDDVVPDSQPTAAFQKWLNESRTVLSQEFEQDENDPVDFTQWAMKRFHALSTEERERYA